MKTLEVPFLSVPAESSLQHLSGLLDELEPHSLENGWFESFGYRPKVVFRLAHGDDCLYLKYYVQEQTILARFHASNEPVYKDSCVELFIAFDENSYYNLEFNCLGTCLMELGSGRAGREKVDNRYINQIKRHAVINREHPGKEGEDVQWQLTLVIPTAVFFRHSLPSLAGRQVRANFQKCGDDLPQPHYLSWTKIDTPEPDFHQPSFFGEIRFL